MRRLGDVGAAGNNVGCHVIDLSASGAAISIGPDVRLLVGVMVTVGKTQGRVVRHIENGASRLNSRDCSTPISSKRTSPDNRVAGS